MNRWISAVGNPSKFSAAVRRRVSSLRDPDRSVQRQLKTVLEVIPRYTPGKVSVPGWNLEYLDATSLLSAFDTIVVKRWNDFNPDRTDPIILDCGANIGISSIHYKHLFPSARITAFEPDARICRVLRRNLTANGVLDVNVIEAAVWTATGQHQFFSEGADANRLIDDSVKSHKLERLSPVGTTQVVETVRLADFLAGSLVDFVKLDIEGAEAEVVVDCAEYLHNVQNIVIEFHLTNSRPKGLADTLGVLADTGFHLSVGSYGPWVDLKQQPAIPSECRVEFDQNLLICGWGRTQS